MEPTSIVTYNPSFAPLLLVTEDEFEALLEQSEKDEL